VKNDAFASGILAISVFMCYFSKQFFHFLLCPAEAICLPEAENKKDDHDGCCQPSCLMAQNQMKQT
jgi:hypothetical protein